MGWDSESGAFLCPTRLLPGLRNAAKNYLACCRPIDLRARMLHGASSPNADDGNQRVNLTQLAASDPALLPRWFLTRCDSHGDLSAEYDQVYFTPDPRQWCFDPRKEQPGASTRFRRFTACPVHAACTAAHHTEYGVGFLITEPVPLPLALLGVLDTADMLALSRTCRTLHCASHELVRREEAAWHSMRARSMGSEEPAPYDPAAVGLAAGGHSSSDCDSEDEIGDWSPGGTAAFLPLDEMTISDRRRMRCMSLLFGSPEGAKRIMTDAAAHDPRAGAPSPFATTMSAKYGTRDAYSRVCVLFKAERVTLVEMAESEKCNLYVVPPSRAAAFAATVRKHIAHVRKHGRQPKESRWDYSCEGDGPHEWDEEDLQHLAALADVAAERGEAVCVLHTVS